MPTSPRLPLATERRKCAGEIMCRNIRILFNFDPPTTDEEIAAAALQYVRKVSGGVHASRANQRTFERAVDEITASTRRLVSELVTTAPPRNREDERQKARARNVRRFGGS
jgi:hypothetical protein